ncbi:hypothetical protein QBC44DRAFT_309174 [Cladorrhinum sp. PSN332]|nr:hypothetical protein QBC44DRAFT_309174 [Cladorrhinum sp. PSN332]
MHFFHDFRGQDPTMRDAHPSWVSTESRWIGVLVPTLLVLFGQLAFTWFGYAVVVFASRRDIPCSDQVRSEGCAPPDSDVSPYPDSTQQLHHEEDLDLEAISLSVHDLELLSWKFDFFSRKVRSLLDTKTQVIPHKPNGSLSHRYGKSSKGLNRVNGEALLDDLDYLLAELDRLSHQKAFFICGSPNLRLAGECVTSKQATVAANKYCTGTSTCRATFSSAGAKNVKLREHFVIRRREGASHQALQRESNVSRFLYFFFQGVLENIAGQVRGQFYKRAAALRGEGPPAALAGSGRALGRNEESRLGEVRLKSAGDGPLRDVVSR